MLSRRHGAVLALALSGTAVLSAGSALALAPFSDGPFGVHEAGVRFVADAGVTAGCSPTSYCPSQPVSRGQMATFLHRLSGNAPNVPPSVNAESLDGASLDDLTAYTYPEAAAFSGGLGMATCSDGAQALSGLFELDEGSVPTTVASFPVYDEQTGQESWLMAFADPATGELAGSGVVGVQCLATVGSVFGRSAPPAEVGPDRLRELYEAGPRARPHR